MRNVCSLRALSLYPCKARVDQVRACMFCVCVCVCVCVCAHEQKLFVAVRFGAQCLLSSCSQFVPLQGEG